MNVLNKYLLLTKISLIFFQFLFENNQHKSRKNIKYHRKEMIL